jgi:hypothetical protein
VHIIPARGRRLIFSNNPNGGAITLDNIAWTGFSSSSEPLPASVTLGGLVQLYDGTPRGVVAVTEPEGLAVAVTYDGAAEAPSSVGDYTVMATVAEAGYEGSATGTLVIREPGSGSETLFGLETFDGFTHTGSDYAGGAFPGQDGSTWTFAKARGDWSLNGASPTLQKANGAFVRSGPIPGGISMLSLKYQKVLSPSLNVQVYVNNVLVGTLAGGDGTVQTWTSGMLNIEGDVEVLISNRVNSGTVTLDDLTWTRYPPVALVSLEGLEQVYDGAPKAAGATTDPAGLSVEITYDDVPEAPVTAGSYAVVATVAESGWTGSASGTLVVSQAGQTIEFPPPDGQLATDVLELSASASSGLPVAFAVTGGPAVLDGSTLAFTGAGAVTVVASQAGDRNWQAADDVVRSFPVAKAPASVTLGGLAQTYDGTPRSVTAATEPEGLAVAIAYNGLPEAPTQAGDYAVEAVVVDDRYDGSASGVLVVSQAGQTIEFPQPDGQLATDVLELSASASSGLPVAFAVTGGPAVLDGSTLAFTGAGPVAVVASQAGDNNWQAAADIVRSFGVAKAPASVTLGGLAQTYDGTPRNVTAATDPEGLAVTVTYNGSAEPPVNAGGYAVTATVDDARYEGSATASLQVARATAKIQLENLIQVYDGGPKAVSVETNPDELPVVVTYLPAGGFLRRSSSTEPPVQAGTYAVEAYPGDVNFEGYAGGTLEILPASQTIEFPEIGDQSLSAVVELAATASSGLPVEFAVLGGPALLDDRTLTFTGAGDVSIEASQPGDGNWEPAPPVVRSFRVVPPAPVPELSTAIVHVREGGEGRFFVRLDREPTGIVVVAVSRLSGDEGLTVQTGALRVFRPSNWNTWQAVVLAAAGDENSENETATFRVSAPGTADQFVDAVALDDDQGENLALASAGARISGGIGASRPGQLIDGVHAVSTNYGYTVWTETPPGEMILDLNDTMTVSRVRLLNWNWVHRTQRYQIESSLDGQDWTLLVDASDEDRQGWDDWAIADEPMRYLRLTGLSNSAGTTVVFSELEVLGERPPLPPLAISKGQVNVRAGGEGRFFVRLNEVPDSNILVTISPVEGEAVRIKAGALRVLRPTNWDVWQAVVLEADAGTEGQTARFRVSMPGKEDRFVDATVMGAARGVNLSAHASMSGTAANLLDAVIDGVHATSANYGYAVWTETPPGTMTMDLKSVATVTRMRLLNWDWVHRTQRYRIDSSVDGVNWSLLADASDEARHGWDDWAVDGRSIRYLRFTGISNSANDYVCIAEWEVYGDRPALQQLDISREAVNVREGGQGRFFVRMTNAPDSTVLVRVDRVSGDETLSVQSGAVRAFTPANWDVWQSVTLAAAPDADAESNTATFRISAPGAEDSFVVATTLDGDIGTNVALASSGSTIWGYRAGVQERLIDGIHDLSYNYGHTMWTVDPIGTTTLDLGQPTSVSRVRLLNWDWTFQTQTYRIEASLDTENWTVLVDTSDDPRHGWDDWAIDGQSVRFLRLTGLSNSVGSCVVISELEVYGERTAAKTAAVAAKTAFSAPAESGFTEEWDSIPMTVLTSDGPADETGWNALDGDPDTAWVGQKTGGGYLVIGYEPALVLSAIEVDLAAGSLADVEFLYSLDAEEWRPLPEDMETNPVELNYLWLVFPDDGNDALPAVHEIRTNP